MELLNVCIYLRKSRADREAEARGEGETLARHERLLLDLAKKRGYNVGAIYKEIVSGETISARPVMQQLLREVESGMWDGVLVVEVERLARGDTIDQGVVARSFQYSNTLIITPLKTYDPNNEYDEEYFEFGLFMSRREYKTIRRRLTAGRESSAKEGKYCGSKPPYGYSRVKLVGEKGWTLQPVPDQAEIVKLIFNLYVHGVSGERIGMAKICRKLNDSGIKTMDGGLWTISRVQAILRNPVYEGMIRWNSRKAVKHIKDGQITISRPFAQDYILVKGRHPAIVSRELFQQAQDIVNKNPARPLNSLHVLRNPLAGIVRCGKCGHVMTRKSPNGRQGDLIRCPYSSCSNISSKLPLVEKALLDGIQELVDGYRLNNSVSDQEYSLSISEREKMIQGKLKEIDILKKRKQRQYDLLEQGIYSTEEFLERSRATAAELSACDAVILSLKQEIEHEQELQFQRSSFIPKCEDLLANYWTWDTSTKNRFLRELIEKAVYTKNTKNTWKNGDDVSFTLDIYPKIQQK